MLLKEKTTLAVIILLPVLLFSRGTIDLSLGFTMPGNQNLEIETASAVSKNDYDTNGNFALFCEYVSDLKLCKGTYVGAGLHYLFPHEVKIENQEEYPEITMLPIYGIFGYKHNLSNKLIAKTTLHAGYGFMSSDNYYFNSEKLEPKGGLYWAAGLGVIFKEKYFIDLIYGNYNADSVRSAVEDSMDAIHAFDINQNLIILKIGTKIKL